MYPHWQAFKTILVSQDVFDRLCNDMLVMSWYVISMMLVRLSSSQLRYLPRTKISADLPNRSILEVKVKWLVIGCKHGNL